MGIVDPGKFRELVGGRRRGAAAALLRLGLRIAEVPYTLAVRWRNHRYDTGRAEVHRIPVPVVSVGNLTLGGTGKTPMVEWIARWFRQRGVRVTVVSRGYGAEQGALNDEGRELEAGLPDVPHVQNPDRVAGARMAVEEFDCQAIVLDDAFQHRRIARDVNLVMLDAAEPFGFEHVFPRGTAPRTAVGAGAGRHRGAFRGRSDRCGRARGRFAGAVAAWAPHAAWAEVVHAPRRLINASGEEASLESLANSPVAAFCGVGNPAGFQHTLRIVRVSCYRVARICRSLSLHAGRRGLAGRMGRAASARRRPLHAQGSGQARDRSAWQLSAVGGRDRLGIRRGARRTGTGAGATAADAGTPTG